MFFIPVSRSRQHVKPVAYRPTNKRLTNKSLSISSCLATKIQNDQKFLLEEKKKTLTSCKHLDKFKKNNSSYFQQKRYYTYVLKPFDKTQFETALNKSSDNHHTFMRQAIQLSKKSVEHGNHPFGALLVVANQVVLTAENTIYTHQNPLEHAENNVAHQIAKAIAAKQLTLEQIKSSILYTSTEPCAMCSGALETVGVREVVFGCTAKTLRQIIRPNETEQALFESHVPACQEIFMKNKRINVIGPVLEDEAKCVHRDYWPNLKKVSGNKNN